MAFVSGGARVEEEDDEGKGKEEKNKTKVRRGSRR